MRNLRDTLFTAVVLACAAATAPAQEPAKVLVTTPKWEVGQRFDVVTVKSKSKLAGGRVIGSQTGRHTSTLRVAEVNDRHVVLVWTHGEATIDGPLNNNPIVREMANMWKGQRMELVFDAQSHAFERVRNLDEVQGKLDKTLQRTREIMVQAGRSPEQAERAVRGVRQMFANPEGASALLIKDIGGLVGFFGRELDTDAATLYELELPNPFGGPPIPAIETWQAPRRVEGADVYDLQSSQQIDAESFGESIGRWAEGVAPDQADIAEKMMAAMKGLVIDTRMTFRYDAGRGLMTRSTLERTVTTGGQGQTEKVQWTLTPAKAAE